VLYPTELRGPRFSIPMTDPRVTGFFGIQATGFKKGGRKIARATAMRKTVALPVGLFLTVQWLMAFR